MCGAKLALGGIPMARKTTKIQCELKPVGIVLGIVFAKLEPGEKPGPPASPYVNIPPGVKIVTPRRVILRGPGGERVLTPDKKLTMEQAVSANLRGQDIMVENGFQFTDLPQGNYDLTVEAEGYKPYTEKINVVPGKSNSRGGAASNSNNNGEIYMERE